MLQGIHLLIQIEWSTICILLPHTSKDSFGMIQMTFFAFMMNDWADYVK